MKTNSIRTSGTSQIVYGLLSQPQKHLQNGKQKKNQGSHQRFTASLITRNVHVIHL